MRPLLDEIPTELPSSMKPSLSSRVVPQAGCERHEESEDEGLLTLTSGIVTISPSGGIMDCAENALCLP